MVKQLANGMYTEISYQPLSVGISGFPSKEIPEEKRWVAYVQEIGTKCFGSLEEAEEWVASKTTERREQP